jgi:hypothetical protein
MPEDHSKGVEDGALPAQSRLTELADEIRQEHHATETAWTNALSHAIACGQKLLEAKTLMRHGLWGNWLEANFPGSRRTATNYARLARNRQTVASLPTVRDALDLLTSRLPAEPIPPVRALVLQAPTTTTEATDTIPRSPTTFDVPIVEGDAQPPRTFDVPRKQPDRVQRRKLTFGEITTGDFVEFATSQTLRLQGEHVRMLAKIRPEDLSESPEQDRLEARLRTLDATATEYAQTVTYMTGQLLRPDEPNSWGPGLHPSVSNDVQRIWDERAQQEDDR